MFGFLHPKEALSHDDVRTGLRHLLYDGICSQTMVVLTLGPFLLAFAVLLGASNATVGVLGAIGPLAQIFQIPVVVIIERLRMRKAITIVSAVLGRLAWLVTAAVPFFVPVEYRMPAFIGSFVVFHLLNASVVCAFNSWVRDVIPEDIFGDVFGRRMAWATGMGVAVSLAGGLVIEMSQRLFGFELPAYSALYVLGAASGLIGVYYLSRIPEPKMYASAEGGIGRALIEPFRDANFLRFLFFIGAWSFGVNFSGPFFAIYILKRLGLTIGWLVGLSVVSQLINLLFFRLWGSLADRFSNKSVLLISLPMFILTFLMWPLTSNPEPHMLTIPILLAIHLIGGVASAGVLLAANNLTLKTAPRGKAAAYLATSALVAGVMGSVAPLMAGMAADSLEFHEIKLTLSWIRFGTEFTYPPLSLKGLDFIFLFSALVLVYSMHRLLAVREDGEAEPAVVRREFFSEIERKARQISTVAGLRVFADFTYSALAVLGGRGASRNRDWDR